MEPSRIEYQTCILHQVGGQPWITVQGLKKQPPGNLKTFSCPVSKLQVVKAYPPQEEVEGTTRHTRLQIDLLLENGLLLVVDCYSRESVVAFLDPLGFPDPYEDR